MIEPTAGPYRIEATDSDYYLFDIISESNGSHVASVVCQQEVGVVDPLTEANASLFAAAWELREALRPFVEMHRGHFAADPNCKGCSVCRARDALAKATENRRQDATNQNTGP